VGLAVVYRNLAIVQEGNHRGIRRFERQIRQNLPKPVHGWTGSADHPKDITLDASEVNVCRAEQPRARFGNRVERTFTVFRLAGDNAEYVGSCRLPVAGVG
jgi:hypothetical protein